MASARLALLLASVVTVACSPGIADLNARPTKYYQEASTITGRISRMQTFPAETLLEVADAYEHRILVHTTFAVDATIDDWVKVSGVLVPEARVADRILYDIIQADSVSQTRVPFFRDLF